MITDRFTCRRSRRSFGGFGCLLELGCDALDCGVQHMLVEMDFAVHAGIRRSVSVDGDKGTCSRSQKHNEINKMAHQQPQRNTYTAGHKVRTMPSCACVG